MELDALLFEKEASLGGCLRTDSVGEYKIDRTGHLLHFRDPYVRRVMFEELSIDWLHFDRRAEIHILDRRIPYPIQYNLHALPEETRSLCLQSYLALRGEQPSLESSFEHWSRMSYGDVLHELFFEPYNTKLWQTDLGSISAEWAAKVIPLPNRELVVGGALSDHQSQGVGYNASFSYPRSGGSGVIVDALAADTTIPIHTCAELVEIDPIAKICEFSDGTQIRYGALVNTIPLPVLLRRIRKADSNILQLAEGLRHNSVFYFAFGYRTNRKSPDSHWVYIPERRFSMYRVGTLSNYSPLVAPAGSVLICAEIAYPGDAAARVDPAFLRGSVLNELDMIGFVESDWKLEFEHHGSIDCAYVIFDKHRRMALPRIQAYLEHHHIYSVGRYGAWGYGSMGDALIEGRDCAARMNGIFGHESGPVR
jgi:protoporphyrinogen oxidase